MDQGRIPGAFRHRARALYTERLVFLSMYIDGLPITMSGRSIYPVYLALTDTWSACIKSSAPKMIAVGFVPLGHAAHVPNSQQARARRTLISMFFQAVLHSLRERAFDRAHLRSLQVEAALLTVKHPRTYECITFRLVMSYGAADYCEAIKLHGMVSSRSCCTQCHETNHTLRGIAKVLSKRTVTRRRWSELEVDRHSRRDPLLHSDAVRKPLLVPTLSIPVHQRTSPPDTLLQTPVHAMVNLSHMRSSMWPIDPLHSCGTLASHLLSDISVIVCKLFALSQATTLDALSVVWN